MLSLLAALNKLRSVDVAFFVAIAAIIALAVAIYFLIPIINKKQYKEMRDNLKKREVAFNANKQQVEAEAEVAVEADQTPESKEE